MNTVLYQYVVGLVVTGLGGTLFLQRQPLGRWATRRWRNLGIDVPEALYAKQFGFIGVLLMILGVLTVTGLLPALF